MERRVRMSYRPRMRVAPARGLTLTQRHINEAIPNNSRECAAVYSLNDAGATHAIVHRGRVSFTKGGERFSYEVPPGLQQWLLDFDADKTKVKPRTFRLQVGVAWKAGRTGSSPDKTEHTRHQKGGRAARKGFKGKRTFILTKTRVNGFPVIAQRGGD